MTALALAATAALTAFVPPAVGEEFGGYLFAGETAPVADDPDHDLLPGVFYRFKNFFEELGAPIGWEHPGAAAGLEAIGRDDASVDVIAFYGPELTAEQLEDGDFSKIESVYVNAKRVEGEPEVLNISADRFIRIV